MSALLMEGDIRAPEVWLRVDIHDRRASPIGVPNPAQVLDALLGPPAMPWSPPRGGTGLVPTLKATPES